ncbi:MAG: hypothetical protein IPO37_03065 [Saprospiraceae bacterium]|nr:hypothetical protein [Saprospiraceae bacterium]
MRWKRDREILEEFLQIYSGIKYCILVLVDKEKEKEKEREREREREREKEIEREGDR